MNERSSGRSRVVLGIVAILVLLAASWQVCRLQRDVAALRATIEGELLGARDVAANQRQSLDRIHAAIVAQQEPLERLANSHAPPPAPTLADIHRQHGTLDAAAVEAARKGADASGRIPSLLFMEPAELLRKFGPPSLILTREGAVTWLYRVDDRDRILRLELAGGIVINAFDR
jgi:hypothetical protein